MHGSAKDAEARIYSEFTLEERALARDWDAMCWGSLDVSEEDVHARTAALTPERWAHFKRLLMARGEVSRERQCLREALVDVLERLIEEPES
jgi:hypothetical protein